MDYYPAGAIFLMLSFLAAKSAGYPIGGSPAKPIRAARSTSPSVIASPIPPYSSSAWVRAVTAPASRTP